MCHTGIMRTNRLCSVVVLMVLLFGSSPAFAHEAGTTIQYINGAAVIPGQPLPLMLPYIPFTVMIEGVVSHEGDGNLNRLSLWGKDNGVYFYEPQRYFLGSGNATSAQFSIPWTIASEGIHRLKVEAEHDAQSPLVSQCKAAPAMAAEYLRDINQSPRSVGKIISRVAQETGLNGELSVHEKCEPGYEDDVLFYVMSL